MKAEIEEALDNASVLKAMLKEYKLSATNCGEDEMLTIKELYRTCKKLKQSISIVAEDLHLDDDILGIIHSKNELIRFYINVCKISKNHTFLVHR